MCMTKNYIEALESAGLSEREAKAYLALFSHGEATVQELARITKLKRAGLYDTLEELSSKGIIHKIIGKTGVKFRAEHPDVIKEIIDRERSAFIKILPELSKLEHGESYKPKVSLFSGKEGFQKIWEELFTSNEKEFYIITDAQHLLGYMKEHFIEKDLIAEKIRKGIVSKQLIVFSEYAKKVVAKDKKENRISKYLPHYYKLSVTKIICGNTIVLISPIEENLLLHIVSPSIAATEKAQFDALWELLPNSKSH